MRKDVARNRALLLETADRLLAARGLGMTLHELADAAGLGVGTVYRHFADKQVLMDALVEQRFIRIAEILLVAEQIEDPVQAFREAILRVCERQLDDRAVMQAMLSDTEHHRRLAREHLLPTSVRIVERALAAGRVRSDVRVEDFPMIFMFAGSLATRSGLVRPELWRRYVEAILDGFMIDDVDRVGATVPAPSEAVVESVMASST